jgi:hypothetical protein
LQHARSVLLQTMPEHPFLEYIYEGLIDVYLEQGEVADLAVTLQDLANLYYSQGRYIERIHQYAEIVKNEQLKKEQPWIVADSHLNLGINNLLFIRHWLPNLDPAEVLGYFEATEEALTRARKGFEELEEQENVEYVQTVLEALYQDWSMYSEEEGVRGPIRIYSDPFAFMEDRQPARLPEQRGSVSVEVVDVEVDDEDVPDLSESPTDVVSDNRITDQGDQ